MHINKKSMVNIFLILSFAFALFAASEMLFIVNHKHDYAGLKNLLIAKNIIKKNPQKQLSLIYNAALDITFDNTKIDNKYPRLEANDLEPSKREITPKFVNALLADIKVEVPRDNSNQAKMYYGLGLIAHANSYPIVAENLLKSAVYINPYLSYYHIELANLYLTEGKEDKASNAINFCFRFETPTPHCLQYKQNNLDIEHKEKVGFLSETISSFTDLENSNY